MAGETHGICCLCICFFCKRSKAVSELIGVKCGLAAVFILDLDKADTNNAAAVVGNVCAPVLCLLDAADSDIFQCQMLCVDDVAAVIIDQAVILEGVVLREFRVESAVYLIFSVGHNRFVLLAGKLYSFGGCCFGDCRKAASEFFAVNDSLIPECVLDLDKADCCHAESVVCDVCTPIFCPLDAADSDIVQRQMLCVNDVAAVVVNQTVVFNGVPLRNIRVKADVHLVFAIRYDSLVFLLCQRDIFCRIRHFFEAAAELTGVHRVFFTVLILIRDKSNSGDTAVIICNICGPVFRLFDAAGANII